MTSSCRLSAGDWRLATGDSLRVLVDASAAFNQGAGIGRYARHVVPAAARVLPGVRFTLLYAPSRPGSPPFGDVAVAAFPDRARVSVRRAPLSRRRLDQLWFRARVPLPAQAFAGPADIVHSPDFTAPPAGRAPRLATFHDLAFLVCPEHAPPPLRAYLSAVIPRQVATVVRVLTVSETTRRDLLERLRVPSERVVVVPNGVEERFFAASPPAAAARTRLGLPADYLLSVGTIEPRKNLATLFAALRVAGAGIDLPLVVAGRRGWGGEAVMAAAEPLRRQGRVRFLGFVPDEDLPSLYAGAAALVYPSWYEGFGLPVLEALAAGVPVVASTAPALREVAGDAAVYADPGDAEGLAAAIATALDADRRASSVREARRRRARCFGWERAGEALARVLAEVADAPRRGRR